MIVVPAMRQAAVVSVGVSQYASRPPCRLRIDWTPGRGIDDTASRIENIVVAIDFFSYCGQLHQKITRAGLVISRWMDCNPERTIEARDWHVKVEIPASWWNTIVRHTHSSEEQIGIIYIRKGRYLLARSAAVSRSTCGSELPFCGHIDSPKFGESSLTLVPIRWVWSTLNSDLR